MTEGGNESMQKAVKNRFLTKTRFKLAVECPTKLYYTGTSVDELVTAIDQYVVHH